MTYSVRTEVLTMERVSESAVGFVIPGYQRPYVWHDDDVLKLIEDIKNAYVGGESHYFIGSSLSAYREEKRSFELIDGQQRTTSLMLIALAFKIKGVQCALANLAIRQGSPRLQFEIRDSVQHLLGSLAGLEEFTRPGDEDIRNDPYLTRIQAALTVLAQRVETYKKDQDVSLEGLADFIYCRVQWVNNVVPATMDLNRLFSSLNTAGIQLEPVDILKSKLFNQITSEKALYSAIWQACEHTGNYFERNLRQLFANADWEQLEYRDLSEYDEKRFGLLVAEPEAGLKGVTIAQLADEPESDPREISSPSRLSTCEVDKLDDETVYCRSIISFELLLLHTLRIFYANSGRVDIDARVKVENLLLIFDSLLSLDEKSIKGFIKLLWKVRYVFDTWVVKWVERDDSHDPQLRLTRQSHSRSHDKSYINRQVKELSELVQLQAVRNFTGDRSAHYWLTPFLSVLVNKPEIGEPDVLAELERIDNVMSQAVHTQKQASFSLAKGENPKLQDWQALMSYLQESNSTGFEHYWFQKLEYILWKQGDKSSDEKLKKYRITSKNSVEHVHPQHEEYNSQLESKALHAFGNLVLLSPSENSSYSSQAVAKKKADFISKPHYDALKLKEIFRLYDRDQQWSEGQINEHQRDMLHLLAKHYGKGMIDGY
ncbi:MAG: DUF262 domain-containing HNH endonuclease family protein [Marinobacterium sp.]|nr:DUF262 domain-containing HNH endonuclease family protein [Marinobacterium sp.]